MIVVKSVLFIILLFLELVTALLLWNYVTDAAGYAVHSKASRVLEGFGRQIAITGILAAFWIFLMLKLVGAL